MTAQSVLLLGATGFIGKGCLKQLLKQDSLELRLLLQEPDKFIVQRPELGK